MADQQEKILAQFGRRYTRWKYGQMFLQAAVLFALGIVAAPDDWWRMGFIVIGALVAAVGLILTLVSWRCPVCDKYLGRDGAPTFCPHCGVRLQVE